MADEAAPDRGATGVQRGHGPHPDPGCRALRRLPIAGRRLSGGLSELPRWLAPNPPATFAWNISGDSMRGAGIFDRDLAIADRSLKPGNGSVVVAIVDGTMSLKRLVIEGYVARLAFDNPDLPAFAVEDLIEGEIWGVVRFSIRWHVARAGLVR